MNYTKCDRKQVFGAEELDEFYLLKIKRIVDERVKEWTLKGSDRSITLPLSRWLHPSVASATHERSECW